MAYSLNVDSMKEKADEQYLHSATSKPDHNKEKEDEKDSDEKTCHDIIACDRLVNKEIKTVLPVFIKPMITPQKPHVECVGDAEIYPGIKQCENPKKTFDFTVIQDISVKIPIGYSAEICLGEECFEAADKI